MIIQEEQFNKIKRDESFDIVLQAFHHLKSILPNSVTEGQIDYFKKIGNNQIANARKYGITDESNQLQYLIVAYLFGSEFDTKINIFNTILTGWNLKDNEKMEFLNKAVVEIYNIIEE